MTSTVLPYRDCVGVVMVNADNLIFTGERLDTPDAWQMPQGGIDKGEAPVDAAYRELEEETGVTPTHVRLIAESPDWFSYDLPPHLIGKTWGGRYRGQRQRWYVMRFLGSDDAIRIDTADPEFRRWRWSSFDAALDHIVPFKYTLYENVLQFAKGALTDTKRDT